jgi:hypothetical protein
VRATDSAAELRNPPVARVWEKIEPDRRHPARPLILPLKVVNALFLQTVLLFDFLQCQDA